MCTSVDGVKTSLMRTKEHEDGDDSGGRRQKENQVNGGGSVLCGIRYSTEREESKESEERDSRVQELHRV